MTKTTNFTAKNFFVGSVATLGILALASPALAYHGQGRSSDVTVVSNNSAAVVNEVVVSSDTGYNSSVGGNTGSAGQGGYASGHNAIGGDGGNSGDGGEGGTVTTGDATAIGTINNDVNSNNTVVTRDCDCEDRKKGGDTTVRNNNESLVANGMMVDARTGDNMVRGGTSGSAGNGGSAESEPWELWNTYYLSYSDEYANDDEYSYQYGQEGGETYSEGGGYAEGGAGGDSGEAGDGGTVETGESISDALVVNVVNRNVTRVAR